MLVGSIMTMCVLNLSNIFFLLQNDQRMSQEVCSSSLQGSRIVERRSSVSGSLRGQIPWLAWKAGPQTHWALCTGWGDDEESSHWHWLDLQGLSKSNNVRPWVDWRGKGNTLTYYRRPNEMELEYSNVCVRRHLTSLQLNLSPEFEAVVGVIKWPRFDLPTGCLSNCRILVGIGNQLLWHDWLTHQLVFRLKAQMYVDHVVHDGHYVCADFHQ